MVARSDDITRTFDEVVALIREARQRALRSVNAEIIDLYWRIGETISQRIADDGWDQGTVAELAAYIQRRSPGVRGFSPQKLWRMRQFYEAYRGQPELSTLLRELPWSANLHILSKTKRAEEREFYLKLTAKHRWPVREVARQIDGALFKRAALSRPKLSTALRELHPQAEREFKDAYLLEFLDLPDAHSEDDLHRGLLRHLGRFLTELGRGFCCPRARGGEPTTSSHGIGPATAQAARTGQTAHERLKRLSCCSGVGRQRAARLVRAGQRQDRLRDPHHPLLLQAQAASHAGGNPHGHPGAGEGDRGVVR